MARKKRRSTPRPPRHTPPALFPKCASAARPIQDRGGTGSDLPPRLLVSIAHVTQIFGVMLVAIGYFFTVRPIYQLEKMTEEKAGVELDVSRLKAQAEKLRAENASLVEMIEPLKVESAKAKTLIANSRTRVYLDAVYQQAVQAYEVWLPQEGTVPKFLEKTDKDWGSPADRILDAISDFGEPTEVGSRLSEYIEKNGHYWHCSLAGGGVGGALERKFGKGLLNLEILPASRWAGRRSPTELLESVANSLIRTEAETCRATVRIILDNFEHEQGAADMAG